MKSWEVQINYGIKTGFNEAFIIDSKTRNLLIDKSPESAEIIRPILLGKNIKRYAYSWEQLWLINSHNGIKSLDVPRINVEADYPIIYEYLLKFKDKLISRQDKGDHWSNLRNCAYLADFSKPKIAWGNLASKSQFTFIDNDYFINAPSPFFTTNNLYILSILNSKIGEFYIKSLGMERSGGFIEFKPMYVEQLPIPKISDESQNPFSEITAEVIKKRRENAPTEKLENELNQMVYKLFELNSSEINYLLSFGK